MSVKRMWTPIRHLRKHILGYTQERLAEELDIRLGRSHSYNKSTVSRWENGILRPPREVLEELENMAGLQPGSLLVRFGHQDESVVRQTLAERSSSAEFCAGVMRLPLVRIVGGDGNIRYTYPDGIKTVFRNTRFEPPLEIEENRGLLLSRRKLEAGRAVFENKNMVRLDDYGFGLNDPYDQPYPLILYVSFTDFNTMMVTNRSLDTRLPDSNLLLRDIYAKDPSDFSHSELANPLVVNLSLVTTNDWRIYVARRGCKVATNPGGLGPAISGSSNPVFDFDSSASFNPFLTAQRESFEEVTGPYRPAFSEITLFGLARTSVWYFPFLFGELRLQMSEDDLRSQIPQDIWDRRALIGIPFRVEEVIRFMTQTYRSMKVNEDLYPGTAVFSLHQSLIYQYPDQWARICEMLSSI